MGTTAPPPTSRPGWVPRDIGAGLLLIGLGATGYFGTADLATSADSGIGPGLMPRGTAVLMAVIGALVAAAGIATRHDTVRLGTIRAPLFVLGAVVLFAATVRPLGLVVAGPLAVIVAALADPDSRVPEVLAYALVMTLFCVGLFKYALRLPIPLAPFLIGY
jgi:hypothetical protein